MRSPRLRFPPQSRVAAFYPATYEKAPRRRSLSEATTRTRTNVLARPAYHRAPLAPLLRYRWPQGPAARAAPGLVDPGPGALASGRDEMTDDAVHDAAAGLLGVLGDRTRLQIL